MHSPSEIPRTGISPEAAAWLDANPPGARLEITEANAEQVRAAVREGWEPAMAAVRAEFEIEE